METHLETEVPCKGMAFVLRPCPLCQVPALLQISVAAETARAELLRCENPSAAISSVPEAGQNLGISSGFQEKHQEKPWESHDTHDA